MSLNLSIPLARRLENVKAGKAYLNQTFGIESGRYNDAPCVWFTSVDKLRDVWRFVGYAHDVVKLRHTGYYTDSFQDSVARGIVAQLPARGGKTLYLAGLEYTGGDTVLVIPESYEEKDDAARAADSLAERYAEDEREADEKYQAESQIEELTAENKGLIEEIQTVWDERDKVAACGHLLATGKLELAILEMIATYRKNAKRIETLTDEPWQAVA